MHNVPWHCLRREDSGESAITSEYEVEGYGDVYVDGEMEGEGEGVVLNEAI